MELHKCPVPPTLFINTMVVLESSKKNRERELEKKKKKKRMRALVGTFLNEGEKERKDGGDKEIRTNVYGGKKKKKKKDKRMDEMK